MGSTRAAAIGLATFVSVACFAVPAPAGAYVLPAEFLARLVADARRPSLKDATLHLSIEQAPDGPRLEGRLLLKRPERMRQVLLTTPERVEVIRAGERYVGDGETQAAAGPSHNLLPLLMFPSGKDAEEQGNNLLQGLVRAGVDVGSVALARWHDGFAYVIGGEGWETQKPQLWLDKASFAPIRLLWPIPASTGAGQPNGPLPTLQAQPAGTPPPAATPPANARPSGPAGASPAAPVHELRFSRYVGGIPHVIEEWDAGVRLYRAEAVNMVINQRLEDSLFEPQATRTRPASRVHGRVPRRP